MRFIGVTPRSSDLRSLLRSLCEELRGRHAIAEALSSDVRELVQEFRKHLEGATAEQPAENMLNLDALSLESAKTLLFDRWLRAAGRTVNEAQRRLIEERLESVAACRQPLYLKLLFEKAKPWRSCDESSIPGGSVEELLDQLCQRLSSPGNHGESLVRSVLGYIAAARRGLSETEILEVPFADPDYKRELDEASKRNNHAPPTKPPRIPIAIWSRLRSDLAPYLAERAAPGGNVLALYHRQLAEWVKARFVDEADWNPHRYHEAMPLLSEMESICRNVGHIDGLIHSLLTQSDLLWSMGREAKRLRRIAQLLDDAEQLGRCYGRQGVLNRISLMRSVLRSAVTREPGEAIGVTSIDSTWNVVGHNCIGLVKDFIRQCEGVIRSEWSAIRFESLICDKAIEEMVLEASCIMKRHPDRGQIFPNPVSTIVDSRCATRWFE